MSTTVEIDISRALAATAKRSCAAGSAFPGMRREAVRMITGEGLAAPVFCYRTVPVRDITGDMFDLGHISLHVPGLAEISSKLSAVASIVCTLGAALESRVSELCAERKMSLALALDEIGNGVLMYTARCATLAIKREAHWQNLSSGDTLTPGGSGLHLEQQSAVVQMAGGGNMGVSVTSQGMLSPVKSRSMIVGIGQGLSAQPLHKRCETCSSREQCIYRTR